MKILRSLTATPTDEPWTHPPVHHHTVGLETDPGHYRVLRLGPSALIISHGTAQVILPITELLALAEPHLT